jgi:hypothetical protein
LPIELDEAGPFVVARHAADPSSHAVEVPG